MLNEALERHGGSVASQQDESPAETPRLRQPPAQSPASTGSRDIREMFKRPRCNTDESDVSIRRPSDVPSRPAGVSAWLASVTGRSNGSAESDEEDNSLLTEPLHAYLIDQLKSCHTCSLEEHELAAGP